MLYIHPVLGEVEVKGYYTVKLTGGELSTADRIAFETRYVQALEAALGGPAQVRDLCLAAAAAAGRRGPQLRAACEQAEQQVWSAHHRPPDARFAVFAWSANDLA